jgi:putative membrane protein
MVDDIEKREGVLDPRTYFAAERTLLAWVRTGLAMMGFGFVVARFGLFLRELATVSNVLPNQHSRLSL